MIIAVTTIATIINDGNYDNNCKCNIEYYGKYFFDDDGDNSIGTDMV